MSVILGRLSGAFLLNCELFAFTLLFALPLGLVVAFGSMSRCRLLSGAVKTFVWVIRGTPLMLQIIVIYLGPGLLGMNNPWPSGSGGRMVAAVVAFAINYACYFSEIYRGGVEAVPKGQTEAGQVSGCILDLSIWHSPVFLLNSCLDRFSAPSHKRVGTLYPEVTGSVCLVP